MPTAMSNRILSDTTGPEVDNNNQMIKCCSKTKNILQESLNFPW